VGLLIASGDTLLGLPTVTRSELATIAPVELANSASLDETTQPTRITDGGSRHPILDALGGAAGVAGRHLPDLTLNARLGRLKPLAQSLLAGIDDSPILVVQEAGRGRCAMAAWSATWPWALESDEGLARHRTLWRQMARWLVNRRPAAWVVTDRADYAAPSLGAESSVYIRAGIAGENPAGSMRLPASATPRLRMRRVGDVATTRTATAPDGAGEWVGVPLSKTEVEWRAGLNARNWPGGPIVPGDYEMEFTVQEPSVGVKPDELVARTRFRVVSVDPELQEPTSNLAALRDAAEVSAGGSYRPMGEAAEAFKQLLASDTRRRIERPVRVDFAERMAWLLLLMASAAFGGEWLMRKQAGLR
jgi:hypothetical protein